MKVGLLIATYNRPHYLRQCLESVAAADLSQVSCVLIVDDCSTDKETRQIIDDFELHKVELVKAYCKENRSIKGSLLLGLDILFNTCDVVTNLDGDAIVTPDFIPRLLELRKKFTGNIITGFNCSTKNKDGTIRHKILEQGKGWNCKFSVGGINMMFNKNTYSQIIKPALEKCLKGGGNWDFEACKISNNGYDKAVVVLEPSCVQHIGIDSSMGHGDGGEPPDVSDDFVNHEDLKLFERAFYTLKEDTELKKSVKGDTIKNVEDEKTTMGITIEDVRAWEKSLADAGIEQREGILQTTPSNFKEIYEKVGFAFPNIKMLLSEITLIAVDDNIDRIIKAADISCENISFGEVKLLSSADSNDPRAIKIRHIGSKKEYSQFIVKELAAYVDTAFALIIQHDGYVLNPTAWTDEFLDYDMVGAVWDFRPEKRTANGGFSLRSKTMMDAIAADPNIYLQNDHLINNYAEDHVLFYIYREYLEKKHNVKIAPEHICNQFSIEAWNKPDKRYKGSFGFHGFGLDFSESNLKHKPY